METTRDRESESLIPMFPTRCPDQTGYPSENWLCLPVRKFGDSMIFAVFQRQVLVCLQQFEDQVFEFLYLARKIRQKLKRDRMRRGKCRLIR